jgi:hypothetical protein
MYPILGIDAKYLGFLLLIDVIFMCSLSHGPRIQKNKAYSSASGISIFNNAKLIHSNMTKYKISQDNTKFSSVALKWEFILLVIICV